VLLITRIKVKLELEYLLPKLESNWVEFALCI